MREGQKVRLARRLRRAATDAERLLWHHLRNRVLMGCKFRRQYPIGPYVVDFVCLEARLVLEADGCQHADSSRDALRDGYLRNLGFHVLRFWNHEILGNPEGVCEVIACWLAEGCPPSQPSPARGGRGGPGGLTRLDKQS